MKVYGIEKTNLFKRFQRTANRQHCPKCGALAAEKAVLCLCGMDVAEKTAWANGLRK